MQISVQIGLNWNWPTGTELGKKEGCNILLVVKSGLETKIKEYKLRIIFK